jgi:alkylation response protein AidB-like acyl-CoA dehydrogenase
MRQVPHPSQFLPPAAAAVLREEAAAAENGRDLRPGQLHVIYEQQWFRLFIPVLYGGCRPDTAQAPQELSLPAFPLSLPAAVRLEEGISWADGSVGWTVTLCSGAGWFAGFFPPSPNFSMPGGAAGFFSDKRLCLAGSGAPAGRADKLTEGYRISGRWSYASGALHATGYTANCVLHAEGRPLLNADGSPQIRAFLFTKDEVLLHRDWDTIGLIATGSHAFEIRGRIVPADRCFEITPEKAAVDDPLYRYPFLQLAEATIAANLSGMAIHFSDACESVFAERRVSAAASGQLTRVLKTVRLELEQKRGEFYAALEGSWADGLHIPLSKAAHALAACARHSVDLLYPFGGLAAAKPGTELNRVWRDLHTATQHNLLVFGS